MYKNHISIFIITLIMLTSCNNRDTSSSHERKSIGDFNSTDTMAPVIHIKGNNPTYRSLGSGYVDEGASATDNMDDNIEVSVTGEVDTSTVGVYELIYTAKDKAGNQAKVTRKVIVENITHHGIHYGIVTSPLTGKIWLNKNIGAAYPCSGDQYESDEACEGDFFQWGRNMDGHEDSISITRGDKISGLESCDGKFVIGHADWSMSQHRAMNWSKMDGSSVCPVGFRVPTIDELQAEISHADSKKNGLDFLKMPWGRVRHISGDMYASSDMSGGLGGIWSTTLTENIEETYKDTQEKILRAEGSYVLTGSALFGFRIQKKLRTYGYYVRCVKP